MPLSMGGWIDICRMSRRSNPPVFFPIHQLFPRPAQPTHSLCAGWQPTFRIQVAATMEPGGGIEPPHVRSIVRGCCFRFCFCTRHMSPAAGGCRRVGEKGVIVRAYCPHSHCRIDSICNCAIWHSSQHFINIRLNFMLLFPFVPAKLIQPHMIIIGDQF